MHAIYENYHEGFKLNLSINSTPKESKISFKFKRVHQFHKKLILTDKGNVTFHQAAQEMLLEEQTKVIRRDFNKHSYTMLLSRLNKHVFPYFGSLEIPTITNKMICEFVSFLNKLNLSTITISQYIIALRKVLRYSLSREYIQKVPVFPKIKLSSIPRGGFSIQEYVLLVRKAKELSYAPVECKKTTHRNTRFGIYTSSQKFPHEFAWLIRFMVNSFLRPVDIKLIQHQHIQLVRGDNTYLRISLPETKKHTSKIVTLSAAVTIYENLLKYMRSKGLGSSDDYLFLPEIQDREAAIFIIGKHFRHLLEVTNLRKGSLGQNRSLYSLRHTAITYRLLYGNGIDLLTLARNARTSVEMIERFYASALTPEMNIAMLQSRR
jgi:integrase